MSGHLVLEAFFGSSLLGVHNFVGWMAILATILNALPVSFTILFVVSDGKRIALSAWQIDHVLLLG